MGRSPTSTIKQLQLDAEKEPEKFWGREAEKVNWFRKWNRVLNWQNPTFRWFENGLTNISYNCLDLNVTNGLGEKTALISENENQERASYTYSELLSRVKGVAAAFRGLGVRKGDRIAIYMPTMPEAIIAMLATTRIGAIHIVVFAGFGSDALSERIRLAGAKYLVTTDVTYRKGKRVDLQSITNAALSDPASPVEKAVILNRNDSLADINGSKKIGWEKFLEQGEGNSSEHEPVESNEAAFILATSGTTAKPKLVVHVHGGYQVWLRSTGDWLYRLKEQDAWWSVSDIGWVVGHSYIVYSPLLFGCTTIAYEGAIDHPGPETFYRILERNRVTGIFMAPTGVRLLMRYGTEIARRFNLSSVERVFCAGEVLNPPAWEWLQKEVFNSRVPVIDHMWQTETGGPIICNPYGVGLLPCKPGSATV
ncbi:MAG: AMP-binding protein, partial [Thaumarchaeota archaeon]|nr:AMP-binding protein [Nitrososphaerota archaeon]